MKKIAFIITAACLVCFLFAPRVSGQDMYKYLRLGPHQGRLKWTGNHSGAYSYYHKFLRYLIHSGWKAGCRDWTDEHGKYWPVWITDAQCGGGENFDDCFPIMDAGGTSLRTYWRYAPPKIIVDGFVQNDPWPQMGDEVNPSKIPGTADMMAEGWAGTWMGLTLHMKALAYTSKYHDDYIIYDYEWINTGNVDTSPEIELPNQTLEDLYILNQAKVFSNYEIGNEWYSWRGLSPTDSLRLLYSYPYREKNSTDDNMGMIKSGFIQAPVCAGVAVLHMDTSPTDRTDNPAQPQMYCEGGPDIRFMDMNIGMSSPSEISQCYDAMQFGFKNFYGNELMTPEKDGVWPGTHYEYPPDQRSVKYNDDFSWYYWHGVAHSSCGPYTLKPGESIREVWATVTGTISREKGYEIGRAWENKTCTWPGDISDLAEYYPAFGRYPDLAPTYNDQAKDRWILTGKDSLFNHARAAQFNERHNFVVPSPPPPPSIEVTSLPNRIKISWDNVAETAPDFAGYRVYRAIGSSDTTYYPIFECGKGTANALTHFCDDATAQRGMAYYYYVASFDDGSDPTPDVWGRAGSLESNKFSNRTTLAAHLTRPGGTLSTARVVPNPFNLAAKDLQFKGEQDKIMFMGLPPKCTIKIYTESLDLVKTLEHTNETGDESWGLFKEQFSTTKSGQLIVSGVYLAYIETPSGESTVLKFVVIR